MQVLRITLVTFFFTIVAFFSRSLVTQGLPIPGVPGISPQQIAIKVAARQLTPWVDANQPVIRDWKSTYPTAATLPGKPFVPIHDKTQLELIRASLLTQLAHSTSGIVRLPPGDYALAATVFCTSWYSGNIHRGYAGHRGLWLLAPLRGSRADILAAVYSRSSGKDISFSDVQTLSWALQAGMRYAEFPARPRQLADELIPDYKNRIMDSFPDQVRNQWDKISQTVPNLPSFDSSIASMGDVGKTILDMRSIHDQIIADADNFDAMRAALAPPGGEPSGQNVGDPPWSVVGNNVYERILTDGYLGSTAVIELRVVGAGSSNRSSDAFMVAQAPGMVADTGTGLPLSKYCSGGVKGFGCSGVVWLINNLAIPTAFPDWQPLTVEWDPDFGNILKYFAAHKQSGQWGWH